MKIGENAQKIKEIKLPLYLYLDDRDQSVHEIIQTMKEDHVAFAKDGYELKRIFVNPQANIGSTSNLDPMDSKAYVNLTNQKRGNIGNLEDLSKELSIKRTEKLGFDPIKEKQYSHYSKVRKGKIHPNQRKEQLEKLTKEPIDLKIK